jgi:hypothetical protein
MIGRSRLGWITQLFFQTSLRQQRPMSADTFKVACFYPHNRNARRCIFKNRNVPAGFNNFRHDSVDLWLLPSRRLAAQHRQVVTPGNGAFMPGCFQRLLFFIIQSTGDHDRQSTGKTFSASDIVVFTSVSPRIRIGMLVHNITFQP